MLPCSNTSMPSGDPVCVPELNFCNGIEDCSNGSDEPDDCQAGRIAYFYTLLLYSSSSVRN